MKDKHYQGPITKCERFGDFYDIPLDHGIMILHRHTHGWKTPEGFESTLLSHQAYVKKLMKYAHPSQSDEIIAVNINSGQKVTLWASSVKEIRYPRDMETHTAEPWPVLCDLINKIHDAPAWWVHMQINYKRARVCVNNFAGVEYPDVWIQDLFSNRDLYQEGLQSERAFIEDILSSLDELEVEFKQENGEVIGNCEQCDGPVFENEKHIGDNDGVLFHENGECDSWVKEESDKS